jgi:hypothetical protein
VITSSNQSELWCWLFLKKSIQSPKQCLGLETMGPHLFQRQSHQPDHHPLFVEVKQQQGQQGRTQQQRLAKGEFLAL